MPGSFNSRNRLFTWIVKVYQRADLLNSDFERKARHDKEIKLSRVMLAFRSETNRRFKTHGFLMIRDFEVRLLHNDGLVFAK
jgi:hypothetical protein